AAGELEAVAPAQAPGELLLHGTEAAATQHAHGHAAIAGDGADGQAMAGGHAAVLDHVATVVAAHDLVEVRVVRQRASALHDEIQHRLPGAVVESGEGMGAA